MIYEWKCRTCGERVDIDRHVDDSMLGPSMNEAACDHVEDYVRVYSSSTPYETLRDRGQFERTN